MQERVRCNFRRRHGISVARPMSGQTFKLFLNRPVDRADLESLGAKELKAREGIAKLSRAVIERPCGSRSRLLQSVHGRDRRVVASKGKQPHDTRTGSANLCPLLGPSCLRLRGAIRLIQTSTPEEATRRSY